MKNQAINIIREELYKFGIHVVQILLFGSRARGENGPDSDWDFFVIIDKNIARNAKWNIIFNIKRQLAKLKIPNDIVLNSEDEVLTKKHDVGQLTYYAIKEGIPL